MWFEIIPSFAIITAAMAFPHASAYVINKLVTGNMFRRSTQDYHLRIQYLRDCRLTGDAYVVAGLENIPDE